MNKKAFLPVLCLMLGACGTPAEENSQNEPENTPETAEEETASDQVIWIREPSMELEDVFSMEAVPFVLGGEVEYNGYPSEWYKSGPAEQQDVPAYRTDAVIAKKDDAYGIMDYEGNVLFPFIVRRTYQTEEYVPITWQPYEGFITYDEYGGAEVFSADFGSRSFVMSGGIGGYAPMPFIIDHQILIENLETMEIVPFTNSFGHALAVPLNDEERNAIGCAVVSKDSEILLETDGHCGGIVNGFLKVNETPDWYEPGKTGFVRVNDGKEITGGAVYEDTGYFMDGCAPVRINGKWAYIDEDGTLISDPVFEYAGNLNQGRAYVKYNGLYGILDVRKTKEAGIFINEETVKGEYAPEELIIPQTNAGKPIGTVTVLVDGLNTRSIPSVNGEKKEKAVQSETYDVYEIYEAEGYTWYRIGDARWVADEGSWLNYTAG